MSASPVEFRIYDKLPIDALREKLEECEEEITRREKQIAATRRKCEEDVALDEENLTIEKALRDRYLAAIQAVESLP